MIESLIFFIFVYFWFSAMLLAVIDKTVSHSQYGTKFPYINLCWARTGGEEKGRDGSQRAKICLRIITTFIYSSLYLFSEVSFAFLSMFCSVFC